MYICMSTSTIGFPLSKEIPPIESSVTLQVALPCIADGVALPRLSAFADREDFVGKLGLYGPPEVDRIWGIWGSYYNRILSTQGGLYVENVVGLHYTRNSSFEESLHVRAGTALS